MFRVVSLFLACRYAFRATSRGFISFLSFSAVLGMAFGVATLITVMSVMNGFGDAMVHRFLKHTPAMTVQPEHAKLWQQKDHILKQLNGLPYVESSKLFLTSQAVIMHQKTLVPITIDARNGHAGRTMQKDVVWISPFLASQYGLRQGDLVTLIFNHLKRTAFATMPTMQKFRVQYDFNHDSDMHVVNISGQKLRQLLALKPYYHSGIALTITHPEQAHVLSLALQSKLPQHWHVTDWTVEYGSFFQVLAMQKSMMSLVLMLIIVIAAFSLISSQVMLVLNKKKDIAMLKTMGLSQARIALIFLAQGVVLGGIGIIIGTLIGLSLSHHLTGVVAWIEQLTGHVWLSHALYQMDHLPSKILYGDVLWTVTTSFALCIAAALYPAWKAAKLNPIEIIQSR